MGNPKVVLAGGSGFIGHYLASSFQLKNFDVVVLTRRIDHDRFNESIKQVEWDALNPVDWCSELEGAEAVINLAGRNINCRMTQENKKQILESRVNSASALVTAIDKCSSPPKTFIQCSAVGYYGNTESECDESSPKGEGFLPDVCGQLEKVVSDASMEETRSCILRLGVVLGRSGGAYPILARATKMFLGGPLGDGRQFISWIHIDDLCRLFETCISDSSMQGVYNAVAPKPERNRDLMRIFRSVFNRPWAPAAPVFAVKLGTYLLGANSQIVLEGQNVVPRRLLDSKFVFNYSDAWSAMKGLEEL